MKYTRNNTLKQILEGDWLIPYKGIFFQDDILDLSDDSLTLDDWCKKGIDNSYMDSTLHAVNVLRDQYEKNPDYFIPIWKKTTKEIMPETDDIVLMPFLINKESPCYIVCAGGGYCINALPEEGIETALELNKLGVNAVVVTYRVRPSRYPKPQQDLIRAIQYVRANPKRFHVKDNKIVVMGYSAAGHLCASVGALYDKIPMPELDLRGCELDCDAVNISKRPDAIILCYPVISFVNDPHVGSADSLLGEEADEESRKALSIENLIHKNYPPTFLWHCKEDTLVLPSNSTQMGTVLEENHIPYELHIYPGGWHGCGLAYGLAAEGWIADAVKFTLNSLK